MVKSASTVITPCIGVCSTGIGDKVCRGCKRFAHEVIHWNSYSNDEKQLIINRLNQFLETIVSNKLDILDKDKLKEQVQYQQIKVDSSAPMARWLYELLRAGSKQIQNTEDYGFRVKDEWQRFSLDDIKQFLDQDFHTLSSAHFERYFANHEG